MAVAVIPPAITGDLTFPASPTPPEKPWRQNVSMGNVSWHELTPESLAAYKVRLANHETALRTWRADCNDIVGAAVRLLAEHGFPTSRHVTTVAGRGGVRGKTMHLPGLLRMFGPPDRMESVSLYSEEEWLRLAGLRETREQAAAATVALRDRAITFLLARAQVYGTDFTADNAASLALSLVAQEEIARRTAKAVAGALIQFSGGDECEGCAGWDGESRRCLCGNRRVSWNIEGTFEEPRIYAEAH